MIGNRIKKFFGQEEDNVEGDQDFSNVTKIEISDVQGYGYSRNFTLVTVTEGRGAKQTNLYNVKSVHFERGKHDWISMNSSTGTTVDMFNSENVFAHYDIDEQVLRVGK